MSATVRLTQPLAESRFQWSVGSSGTRPRWGLSPKRPQNAAGMRIEPPPSVARPTAARPAATAAPLPPLEPPGDREVFHGLRVGPQPSLSVKPQIASSGSVVLPITTAPAARNLRTDSPSDRAGTSSKARVPNHVVVPSTSTLSLIATGTPSSGASSAPRRASAASASASARSPSTSVNALSFGLWRSMRSRYSSTSSREETSPERISSAWRAAPAYASSSASTARSYGVRAVPRRAGRR